MKKRTDEEEMMENENRPVWLQTIKVFIEFLKVIVWPLLVLSIFLTFRSPITEIANELPEKFFAATKLEMGSLTLEIQQQAKAAGNPELARSLGGLSPNAIRLLIELGPHYYIWIGTYDRLTSDGRQEYTMNLEKIDTIRELLNHKLIEFNEGMDQFLSWTQSSRFQVRDEGSRRFFIPTTPLTPTEEKRLTKQSYHLSRLGERAYHTVLNAVFEDLRAPANNVSSRNKDLSETSSSEKHHDRKTRKAKNP
jgi:hypothetical protein